MRARVTTDITFRFLQDQLRYIQQPTLEASANPEVVLAGLVRQGASLQKKLLDRYDMAKLSINFGQYVKDLYKQPSISPREFLMNTIHYLNYMDNKIDSEERLRLYTQVADALHELASPWAEKYNGWPQAFEKCFSRSSLLMREEVETATAEIRDKKIANRMKIGVAAFGVFAVIVAALTPASTPGMPEMKLPKL